jgi:eukaryotic-like serine/threonine-protein kinase
MNLTGRTIDGKYVVSHCLGEGGMGAVFLAQHVGIGRPVALKVIQPELLADPSAAERFKLEARAAGTLRHPNIVNVTDFGVTDVDGRAVAYLVMEHLTGQTLAAVLDEQGRLPLRLVTDIVAQIAEALEAAHANGIVHRDLKPANIWLTPDARGGFTVTLLDFGIAKLRDQAMTGIESAPVALSIAHDEATLPGIDATLVKPRTASGSVTTAGQIVGTPAYMSPEQCSGAAVDPPSDIYSLGVVVFRMLAGELPFLGNTAELIRQHTTAPPPDVRERNPSIDADVAKIVARAMAKRAGERFQSARSFAAALDAESLGAMELMRRAAGIFVQRMPELMSLSRVTSVISLLAVLACIALFMGLIRLKDYVEATRLVDDIWIIGLVPLLSGFLAMGVVLVTIFISASVLASVAALYDDLRRRPFAPIVARDVRKSVGGFARPARLFWQTFLQSRGNGTLGSFLFISRYRPVEGGEARIRRMVDAIPRRKIEVVHAMAIFAIWLPVVIVGFAAFGIGTAAGLSRAPEISFVAFGVAFSAVALVQPLFALAMLTLYEAAAAATAD